MYDWGRFKVYPTRAHKPSLRLLRQFFRVGLSGVNCTNVCVWQIIQHESFEKFSVGFIRGSDAESVDDHVDQGDDKNDNDDDVVEDVGRLLVRIRVDVEAADDQKEDAHDHLFDRRKKINLRESSEFINRRRRFDVGFVDGVQLGRDKDHLDGVHEHGAEAEGQRRVIEDQGAFARPTFVHVQRPQSHENRHRQRLRNKSWIISVAFVCVSECGQD